jgi:putative phosphoesterase
MLIGLVSDTHGQMTYTRNAVEILAEHPIEAVLHCGDIGAPRIVDLFAPWPTHFVLGNVDDDDADWRVVIEAAGQHFHGRFADLSLGGRRIAMIHGDDTQRLKETIASEKYDLVCHGHTHVPRNEQIGRTLVLNPGAVYRADPHTIAIVNLATLGVELLRA